MGCKPRDTLFQYPYFTHPCDELTEDHAKHVILHQYVGCIKIPSQWAVPGFNSSATLDVPAVVDILVGCCLWNPDYGHFLVVAYDRVGMKVTVERTETSPDPGTVIPMCTKFIFTPSI